MSHSVLAFLLHDVLGVLQHLLLPQVKEVGGVGVELKCFLVIIPTQTDTKKVIQVEKKCL